MSQKNQKKKNYCLLSVQEVEAMSKKLICYCKTIFWAEISKKIKNFKPFGLDPPPPLRSRNNIPVPPWLVKLDTSKGLPLTDKFTLSAAPPPTLSRFCTKLPLSQFKTAFKFLDKEPVSMKSDSESGTHFYTTLKGDKKHVMP